MMKDIDTTLLTTEQRKNIELQLQTATTRQLFIKIEIIDTKNNVVAEVSGKAISGS